MKLVVVGGGPAGIRAALRARELGAAVTLLERSRLGGTCFNEGPAPVRTLARAARLRADAAAFATFGLEGTAPRVNLKAAIEHATRIAAHANEVRHLTTVVRQAGVEVVDEAGPARLLDRRTLALGNGRRFPADRIVLAIGGQPRKLPIPGNELALSFHDLWSLDRLPAHVTVVGAASTGCQLASILHDFGAAVDLVEAADRLIPTSDSDLSKHLRAAFVARGMNVLVGTRSESIAPANGSLRLVYRRGGERGWIDTDAVFLTVGWPANLEGLNLQAAGVSVDGRYIGVDDYLRTNVPEIFAVGDANGISMLAQSAALQGMVAAENAVLGVRRRYLPHAVAAGSFTDPEYGGVGLTEELARAAGHDCVVEVVRYDELPRAIIDSRTDGMCKLIVDRTRLTVLGAHVLGSYSAEVIQVAATCMASEMLVTEIAELELAFPTFTEAIGIAARRIVRKLRLARPEWTGHEIQDAAAP